VAITDVIHGHVGETTGIVVPAAERILAVRATPGLTRPLRVLDLVGAADSAVYAATIDRRW
jgi:hypothetical protein